MRSYKNCSLSPILADHDRMIQAKSKAKSKATPVATPTPITLLPTSSGITTVMVSLDVELKLLGDKKVKRSFLVPLAMNFRSLNRILHIGFGWTGAHPHQFTCNNGKQIIDEGLLAFVCRQSLDHDQREELYDACSALLSDYIPPAKRFDYEYDFGDRWKHVIRVGKTRIVKGGPYAECTAGQGTTPPEDSGGPIGYAYKCEILSDPTHKGYEDTLQWQYDEVESIFDLEFINARLKRLNFTTEPA